MIKRLALAACSIVIAVEAPLANELVIATTGGAFEKAMKENFFEAFEKETGIKVKTVAANVSEQATKLALMKQSGNVEWDIAYLQDIDLKTGVRDYVVDLGACEDLPNVAANGLPGACLGHGVVSDIGGGVMVYKSDQFEPGKGPKDWTDFWNVAAFPGTRALPDIGLPWWDLSIALRSAGVERDALYPLDEAKAYAQLDKIKPDVAVWWKTGDQSQNLFRSGEIDMSLLYSGRALQLKAEGMPLEIVWSDAVRDVGAFAIVQNAPNLDNAKKFLNFFYSRPEAHEAFGGSMFYGSPVKGASDGIGVSAETLSSMIEQDPVWISENREKALETWVEWLAR
jgi:mannopine transport system substrate-binding protein